MEINLRSASLADMKEMQDLFVETIKNTCSDDYNQEQLTAWVSAVENRGRWEHFLATQYFVVAETGNRIVGYGSLDSGSYLDFRPCWCCHHSR